ncbi:extracellular solute-binding protein [Candidatus Vecturithrix granuli]|uniref:Extracellular solute-binding protein n=1 Tax=Vecturithrix granuli TaxID=1499967 RepID=A0A081BYE1_VECG1|nr:extracellular solute-binding protein [Candidatus Vecturithrix granuli]
MTWKTLVIGLLIAILLAPAWAQAAVEIEFWQYFYESKKLLVDDLIKEFEAQNPDIKVIHQTFPYDSFIQKVATTVPAGRGPDVVTLYYGWFPTWITSGWLQPLPEDKISYQEIEEEFFPMVQSAKFAGKYYGIPTAVRTLALLWNKDLFQQAGLDPEKPPTNWDEFVEYAKATTKRDASGQLEVAGYAFNVLGQDHHWFRECLLRQNNAPTMSEDGKKVLWNSTPEGYEAWQWFVDLVKTHRVGDLSFFPDNPFTPFELGRAAMLVDGSFRVAALKKAMTEKGLNAGVAVLPAQKSPATFASYWVHGITKNAQGEKLDASIKFLKFLTSEKTMKVWLEKVGELPARKALIEDPAITEDPIIGPFVQQLPYAYATFFIDEKINREAIQAAVEAVVLKNEDPKAALDAAVEKVNAVRAEFFDKHPELVQ